MSEIAPFQNVYPCKLILFGEYTVLIGGSALACPIKNFTSYWKQGRIEVTDDLFNHFLEVAKIHPQINFNVNQWEKIKDQKLYLHSEIPQGYGLGSSGNYIAALVDSCITFDQNTTLTQIKNILGHLENFYHGNSSGIDPFVIYFRKLTQIRDGNIEPMNEKVDLSNYFLFDSKIKRKTQPLISLFNEKCSDSKFRSEIEKLQVLNENIIDQSRKQMPVREIFKKISELQFEIMTSWIPEQILNLWKTGLENDDRYFKLCGAGGGGFFIVYQVKSISDNLNEEMIPIMGV